MPLRSSSLWDSLVLVGLTFNMNHNFKDETGKRYSRLLVIKLMPDRNKYKRAVFECLCDCGATIYCEGGNLRSGNSKSCGCYNIDSIINRNTTHGMSKTREHHIWTGIIARCYNKKCKEYKYYGGRGIKMCKRWLNGFAFFFEDMGNCPENHSIDRKNNNSDYKPSNCRWTTQKEQCNNKRNNTVINYMGKKLTISQWSDEIGINSNTISSRIFRGDNPRSVIQKLSTLNINL